PRRHALLSPCGYYCRCGRTRRRDDREACRAVRRTRPHRAAGPAAAETRRLSCFRWRAFLTSILFVALAGPAGSFANAETLLYAGAPTHIEIEATPITSFDNRDPSHIHFGALEFRGGLELTSKNPAFGGISGIHIEPDGAHFLAITDHGSWLRGRILYRDGKPAGIADAEIAPILGPDGKPLAARRLYRAESLTERDGVFYIGIERVEQIVRFDYRRDGLRARGEPIKVPPEFKTFKYNKSLECLTAPPPGAALAGALIVVTERSLDSRGNLRSFLLDGDGVTRFSVKRTDDFDVTDCAILPPGDLLLLERRYSLVRGVAMRIRRVPLESLKADALVDGRPMIEADLAYQIDNMEGVAVHRTTNGETIVTLISDDNFSFIQRNLLLQFAVVGE